jgi:hypothetical protein
MKLSHRESGVQWLRTFAFPLVTVIALLGMTPLGIQLLPILVRLVFYLLAPIVLIASVMYLNRTVTASGDAASGGMRTASIVSLAFLLGFVDLSLETVFIAPLSLCKGNATDNCAVVLVSLAWVLKVVLLGLCGIASIRVVADALSSAASARRWTWFAAMLTYVVASVAIVVVRATSLSLGSGEFGWYGLLVYVLLPDNPSALFPLLPLLTPVLTLIYGLSGRATSVRT